MVLADNGFRFEHHPSWGPIPRGAYKVYATQVLIYSILPNEFNIAVDVRYMHSHSCVFFTVYSACIHAITFL